MKIESDIKVSRSVHGIEVFIQSLEPVTNFVLRLPADAQVTDGESVEFVQKGETPPAVLTDDKVGAARKAVEGKIDAVQP